MRARVARRGALAASAPLVPLLAVYILVTLMRRSLGSDQGSYLGYAHRLLHGSYADASHFASYLWHGPALPMLIAPFLAAHVPLVAIQILVGPVLLFAAVAVFHRLCRMYVSDRAALLCSFLVGAYLPFLATLGQIAVEPLATLCLTVSVFCIVRAYRGSRRDRIWAAIALAVLALARVEFGYVLVAAAALGAVWLLVTRSPLARTSVVVALVAVLLCVPWLAYTYSLTGRPFYWGNSGGLSLYWMTAPGNLGDWHPEQAAFTIPQLASSRGLFTRVNRMTPAEHDATLDHAALQNILRDPTHYLSNVVNNIDRLVFDSPYSFIPQRAAAMLYAVPNALLLGGLILAAFVAVRMRRRLPLELLPIAVLLALGFLVHVPLAAYPRFDDPLVLAAAWLVIAVLAPAWRSAAASMRAARAEADVGVY